MPLQEAAARLGKDPRTIIRAIKARTIRGGVEPRLERHRWYVYVDELPRETAPAAAPSISDTELADLRAQVVSLSKANRLLIAAQQELLEVDRVINEAAEQYRSIAQRYAEALSQFMVPGTVGDLADL